MITLNDLTVKQVMDIKNITVEDDVTKALEIVSIVYKTNAEDISINEFQSKLKDIDLSKPVDRPKVKKSYVINGTKYILDKSLNISTAQYVDYTNYMKEGNLVKILSVFLIPEGHKYNDGYDIFKVMKDMEEMSYSTATSIGFFFLRLLKIYIKLFLPFLIRKLKKTNPIIAKQVKEQITILLNNLESCLTF